jgi:hypothetical protein
LFYFVGEDLAERGAQETSSVVVETVQKVSKSKQVGPVLPLFKSDASKVTSKGMGLKKAYLQKQNMFTVHAGDAGEIFVMFHGLVRINSLFHPSLHHHSIKQPCVCFPQAPAINMTS